MVVVPGYPPLQPETDLAVARVVGLIVQAAGSGRLPFQPPGVVPGLPNFTARSPRCRRVRAE
jgi:hypothetical protein